VHISARHSRQVTKCYTVSLAEQMGDPLQRLVMDGTGNLYGTTLGGGASGLTIPALALCLSWSLSGAEANIMAKYICLWRFHLVVPPSTAYKRNSRSTIVKLLV
jgi:hypothetical protein